jgi:hypothetical protein
MVKRESAVGSPESANGKRQTAREWVTFLTIFISHSFNPSPFINLVNSSTNRESAVGNPESANGKRET